MRKAIPLLLLFTSCNRTNNRWVLQSYDKDAGYVFVQNGVSYQTHCFATGRPMLANNVPDMSPDALPPNLAWNGEADCADILSYLHKPVPLRQINGSVLVFTEEDNQNFKLEFTIKEAK
jgi:hypothetical protein